VSDPKETLTNAQRMYRRQSRVRLCAQLVSAISTCGVQPVADALGVSTQLLLHWAAGTDVGTDEEFFRITKALRSVGPRT
jgi:SRSO17 transposase